MSTRIGRRTPARRVAWSLPASHTLRAAGITLVRAPFRIGATSFVYPDRWLGNVARLAGRVDDVEILLFEHAG